MTIATRIHTWLNGVLVGQDNDKGGNRYYRSKRGRLHGRERRWVIYHGKGEPSEVPAEWHAWLHHTAEESLAEAAAQEKPWQKPHQPNRTGTAEAYLPRGHQLAGGVRASASGDYEPWKPE